MSLEDILILIVAVYGAGLSTLLAVREIRKGNRRVRIFLEYIVLYESARIVITNVGYRSISITGLEMQMHTMQEDDKFEQVPSNSLFSDQVSKDELLPRTISDGEHIVLPLSDPVSRLLSENGMRAIIKIHDAEGREYRKYETRWHNPKWGYFSN
ncbi:hypothetical protein BH24ACT22_BH24ACT22_09290 [soil metagenome]